MPNAAIMIQTRDKRKYFTEAKNQSMLTEFAKTFDAELSLVEVNDLELLNIESLAQALCDESYRSPKQSSRFKVMRKIYPRSEELHRNRRSMIENAHEIREYIRGKLKRGDVLLVKDLKRQFGDLDLSNSCLSNHITSVCHEMKRSGLDVVRLKAGSYKVYQ